MQVKPYFSDHFTLMLTMERLPKNNKTKEGKKAVWNLNKEGAWEKYSELTKTYSEKLSEIEPQLTLSSQINNVLDVLNRWTEKEGTCISANYF